VLNILGFKRFELSEPAGVYTLTGKLEWEIDFFEREDKLHAVRFVRPPSANESWFTKEIIGG
jgi:hypothetical protein